ncbi:helix-turn-helix transcriptional regulator [Actinomadura fibrosa]|uniref:AAA family ATPase n=1 Tax=Actinomadura fibrosa TaxID=111802 RepID=A0ABW2XTA4_9ACTN|nr:helix-turn-helix transcriptional regulator [Actinomadura fibrosa]
MLLIERNDELAALQGLLGISRQAGYKGAVISGGIGTGKTALLRAFTDRALDSGVLVLCAVASRVERNVPFGVLEQLFRSPDLPAAVSERAMRWLESGGWNAPGLDGAAAAPVADQVPTLVLRGIWQILHELADHRPVLISVDEVHYADELSLQCLLYLIRRLRSARLHVVFTESSQLNGMNATLHGEFNDEEFFHRIRLEPLTKAGVAEMLAVHLDEDAVDDLAPTFHEVSAGYPILVQALIEDFRAGSPSLPGEIAAGEEFRRAVLRFLHRFEPPVIEVARAIAVLDRPAPGALLGRLLGMDVESTVQAVNLLTAAEVLVNGCLRHPALRAAVLGGTPATARRATHGRIAELLHNEGVAAPEVASHIVAAERVDAPWVLPILREAADYLLARDEVDEGVSYLRAAYRMSDGRQRQEIASRLVNAEWRVDPGTVLRRLDELSGYVPDDGDDLASTTYLLWHGRLTEALDIIDGHTGREEAEGLTELATAGLWGAYLYPGRFKDAPIEWCTVPGTGRRPSGAGPAAPGLSPELYGADLLMAELARGDQPTALNCAESILEGCRLNARTLAPLTAALAVLIYNDRLDEASAWSDSLLAEAADRQSPTWHALFAAERALVQVRQGHLAGAESLAGIALQLISPESWGVAVGLPLSSLVLARVAMGNLAGAAQVLDHPLPEAMFQSRMGAHYLYARGRFHLATERYCAALHDFHACGRLMSDWGIDQPAVEPWRSGAIEAYLRLGEAEEVRRLAEEQLRLVRPDHRRALGLTLRSRAATCRLEERSMLLDKAAKLLQECGDRLGLAQTLTDQSRVAELAGEPERARDLAREARALVPGDRPAVLDHPRGDDAGHGASPATATLPHNHLITELSRAERRVAALAAAGYTNREISEKLYITVSTVEQHLTRVYRKLNVKRIELQTVPLEY